MRGEDVATYRQITREAVLKATAEFDELGRSAFLKRYGFGPAEKYFLVVDGKRYDSKAIAGVAVRHLPRESKSLKAGRFSGGEATVAHMLKRLGFDVLRADAPVLSERLPKTSGQLNPGQLYNRRQLMEKFSISDATVHTGVFAPKGYGSLWLFITEKKTADRTQYADRFDGDTLRMQGQMQGRTDGLLINHATRGKEVLLFYRPRKSAFPDYAFRYEGVFRYVSHAGERPASFVFQREGVPSQLEVAQQDAEKQHVFDPTSVEDGRKLTMAAIVQRRGQRKFREALVRAYEGRCAISGCAVPDVLEAAHIYPYKGDKTNTVTNGILLRADIHTLFDLALITIDPESFKVRVHSTLRTSPYAQHDGLKIELPKHDAERPSTEALAWHWRNALP